MLFVKSNDRKTASNKKTVYNHITTGAEKLPLSSAPVFFVLLVSFYLYFLCQHFPADSYTDGIKPTLPSGSVE